MNDRYLVEFQEIGKDYFTTDCAFREGQENLACQYVRLIVGGLKHVIAGRVLDTETRTHIYTLRPQDKLAVNIEAHLHTLAHDLSVIEHSALVEADVAAVKARLIAHYAAQIAHLF